VIIQNMRGKVSNLTTRIVAEKETGKDLGKEELKLNQLDLALKYRDLDICVIPVHSHSKIAAIDWKLYETKMPSKDEIKSWFTNNNNYNIGIVLGKVSSCFEIDIDGQGGKTKFDQVFQQLDPNLQSTIKNTMRIVSPNGLKLLFRFRSDEWPEGVKTTKLWNGEGDHDGIELRANGSYSLGVGSIHPTGDIYSLAHRSEFNPLTLLKSEIEELVYRINGHEEFEKYINYKGGPDEDDLEIVQLGTLENNILITIANNARKYYRDGSKNDFTLGFCGQLRRLGVSYEDVYKIVYIIDPADAKNINRIKYIFDCNSGRLAGKRYLIRVLKEQGLDDLEVLKVIGELFSAIEQLKKEQNKKKLEEKEEYSRANKGSIDDNLEAKFKIVEKKPPADILYNLARTTILEQFQDQDTGEIYAVYEVKRHKEVHNMESAEFEYFLRQQFEQDYEKQQNKYFKAKKQAEIRGEISEFLNDCKEIDLKIYPHGIIISKEHLRNTVQQLKASVTEKKKLYLRSFYENGILRYDLMDDKWRYVEINGYDNSVKICEDSYQYFKRYDNNTSDGSSSHAQVEPVIITEDNYNEAKKIFDNLIDSFNILSENESTNDKKLLLKVYWIALYFNTNPKFPMPIPCVSGPYDAAKSTLLATIKYHVDPVKPVTELLDNWGQQNDHRRRGLVVSRNYLTYFDNMSHLTNEESDELCLYATGSKYQERKLHTNTDIVKYHIQANIGYGGINDLAKNPDLLSRILHFELGEIKNKIPFTLYWNQREIERPLILGYIFDVIRRVILRYEKEKYDKKIQTTHRLADFAILGEIIAQELGEKTGRFMEIFQDVVAEEQNTKAIENDSFAQILIQYILSKEYTDADRKPITKWETIPTSLHSELVNFARSKNYSIDGDWDFPHSAVALGKKLTKLKLPLLQAGIKIERKEDRASSRWMIEIVSSNKEESSKVATG
jgi:hypothetical protein